MIFLPLKLFEKWANLRLSLNAQKPKVFQLRPPDPVIRGSVPEPCWGLRSQTPVIGASQLYWEGGGLQLSGAGTALQ